MSDEIEIKLPDLARVALEPGDKILVRAQKRIGQADAQVINARLKEAFPDHAVMILDDGLELAVVRPTDPREDHAWRLNMLQFVLGKAGEAMEKEYVGASTRERVLNRLIYGEPSLEQRVRPDEDAKVDRS